MTLESKIRLALEKLPKDTWYTIEEIESYIEDTVDLSEKDWEIPENKYIHNWRANVRSTLGHMKTSGHVEHEYMVSKGLVADDTIPARYKICSIKNTNVKMRDNNRTKYFDALMGMNKNEWFTLEEIYEHVLKLNIIEEKELKRSKPDNPMPIWKHRIYTTLGHMKSRGYVEHKACVAKVNSPTGKKIPAMYKFIK